jgi:hypothetical protein
MRKIFLICEILVYLYDNQSKHAGNYDCLSTSRLDSTTILNYDILGEQLMMSFAIKMIYFTIPDCIILAANHLLDNYNHITDIYIMGVNDEYIPNSKEKIMIA